MVYIILYLSLIADISYTYGMEKQKRAQVFNGFGILASLFILLSGPFLSNTVITGMVQLFGLLLIIWAILTRRTAGKKHDHKLPGGYFFVDHGPYEIIRHPIYTGFLLIMLMVVEIQFTLFRLIALAILCGAIFMKILREEYFMKQEVPEYGDYIRKTKALIPYLL